MAKKLMTTLLVALMCIALLCACTPNNPSETPNQSDNKDNVDPNPSGNQDDAGSTGGQEDPDPSTGDDEPDPSIGEDESGIKTINISDYLGNADIWEDDGGDVYIEEDHILFDNAMAGDYAALRLTEQAQDVTYKFTIKLSDLPAVSKDDGTWYDAELIIVGRSAVAGNSYQSGEQTGYCLTSWGDMGKVYIGRAGYDDAFGSVLWNINDGEEHEIEFTLVNNEDDTQVSITLKVDGEVLFEGVDDGSKVKNDRTALYPEAGGLTIRCKYFEATVS